MRIPKLAAEGVGPMELYTASEARERLGGMASSTFHRLVLSGKIRKVTPPEKKHGMYVKDDVDALAAELRQFGGPTVRAERRGPRQGQERSPALIDWVEPRDLPKTLALDLEVYNEEIVGDFKLYLSWLKKNPQITLAAFDDMRSAVYAYINLLPLPEDLILAVLRGERAETSITADEILDFNQPGPYTLLAESAVAHPDYPELLGIIMRRFADYWCEWWPERQIHRIYTQAVSEAGLYLVQKLFFAPMYDYPDDAFVLDVQRRNPSKFVRHFQACIETKKATRT